MSASFPEIADLVRRIEQIETQLSLLRATRSAPQHYSVAEFAQRVGRAPYTVREWAREGRILAGRRTTSRGPYREFVISEAELARYLAEGLLPTNDIKARREGQ